MASFDTTTIISGGTRLPVWAWSDLGSGRLKTEDLPSSKPPATRTAAAAATTPAGLEVFLQPPAQTMAKSQEHLDHPLVAKQLDDVSRAVENRPTAPALPEVRLHGSA